MGRDIVSKTGSFFSLLLLVIFGLCSILHPRAFKEVFKTGNCHSFYLYSLAEEVHTASWALSNDLCFFCNEANTKKSWLITKFINTNYAELVHADITVSFTHCPNCKNQVLKVFAIHGSLPINIGDKKLMSILNRLTLLKEIKNNGTGVQETHHVQFASQSSGISIVLLVQGACIIVYKLEVSTFFCEKVLLQGVSLPRTSSPASGNRIVNANCFENTHPSSEHVSGLCGSDGEWQFVTPCLCEEGFTFGSNGCEHFNQVMEKEQNSNIVQETTPSSCDDKISDCPTYKSLDYCASSHRFLQYMKSNCAKTCEFCVGEGGRLKTD